MKKIMNFEVKNYNVREANDSYAIVRAYVVNVGKNNNQTNFEKENIERAIPSILNVPLIGIYSPVKEDFKSHAHNEGEKRQTYAVGVVPESANPHFEVLDNGLEYLVVDMVVWKNYFPHFFDRMARNEEDGRKTTISMEISANMKTAKKMEDGTLNIIDFKFCGICLLGNDVNPRNSRCRAKSFKIRRRKNRNYR